MSFSPSPDVEVTETDDTTSVSLATNVLGVIGGVFNWGPVGHRTLISSETQLAKIFGKPSDNNGETWFCAASYLAYAGALEVVRAANTTNSTSTVGALSAIANTSAVGSILSCTIPNDQLANSLLGGVDANAQYIARYPGSIGDSLRVSVCDSVNAYSSTLAMSNSTVVGNSVSTPGSNTIVFTCTSTGSGTATDANTMATGIITALAVGDQLLLGNSILGTQYTKVTAIPTTPTVVGNTASVSVSVASPFQLRGTYSSNTVTRSWEFFSKVRAAPAQSPWVTAYGPGNTAVIDQLHVVIVDNDGLFSGVPGQVLEVYDSVSRATDSKQSGVSNWVKNVINGKSAYVYYTNDRTGALSANTQAVLSSTSSNVYSQNFVAGTDGYSESTADVGTISVAYDLFSDPTTVPSPLIIGGKSTGAGNVQMTNYIIDNLCETRRDCVAFFSPDISSVVNNRGNELTSCLSFRGNLHQTSFGSLDSGYKYAYDRYNDVYRWVPLNGDIAGLHARTSQTNDSWWAAAGDKRGGIKNVVRLAWSPSKPQRDLLAPAGINPVINIRNQGPELFGQRTLLNTNSAFSRISIRRLFNEIETAISVLARSSMFEFNDSYTQANFRNTINPYLNNILGRRGITNFFVKCDSDNNTGEIIANFAFVGQIFITPNYPIEDIQLNFVAVGPDVTFTEIIGGQSAT